MHSEAMEPLHHGVEDSSIKLERSNKSQTSRELVLVKQISFPNLCLKGYNPI